MTDETTKRNSEAYYLIADRAPSDSKNTINLNRSFTKFPKPCEAQPKLIDNNVLLWEKLGIKVEGGPVFPNTKFSPKY